MRTRGPQGPERLPTRATAGTPISGSRILGGEEAIAWAEARSAECKAALGVDSEFEPLRARVLKILESKERIPYPDKKGDYLYNFWKDDVHVRGILRRTSMESFKTADPDWEIVLDLDRLAQEENENWVWMGDNKLYPDYDRCLIFLSRGGGDTRVMREFDLVRKEFIPDGFNLPAAKTDVSWLSRDTPVCRHGLRARLAQHVRLSADRQGMGSRNADRAGPHALRRRSG